MIAQGFHEKFGGAHAEVVAVRRAGVRARGATLYVTLEPCVHFGKTPPCADFLIKHGIHKVVVAATDPNPLVSGKGLRRLKKAGVKVVKGVLEKEAMELNRDFNHWITKKMPYVIAKAGQSLDGKIATRLGESRWITGLKARAFGHELRAWSDAILVGVNTVLRDNPRLGVRFSKRRGALAPLRIVLDSRLRTPLGARLFSRNSGGPVILAVTDKTSKSRHGKFRGKAEVLEVRAKKGRVDLAALLEILGKRGIVRMLVEGGGEVLASFFEEKLVNEAYFLIAPKIIGGVDSLKDAVRIRPLETRFLGEDLLVHGRVENVHRDR